MKRTHTAVIVFAALFFALGCSSSKKSSGAASGTAKSATTKQPPSKPKPSKKAGSNVTGNAASAEQVTGDDATCTADEDGQGACADTFVVFCSETKVYALDCAAAFGGTCGELDDGTVDCVVDQ
jgi:hypothetical protein